MKKLALVLLIGLVAVMGMGLVSASDVDTISGEDNNTTVTIDGIDFNIPDNFTEDVKHATHNERKKILGISYTNNGKVYHKGNVAVSLLVSNYGDYKVNDMVASMAGGDAKTINNISGYLKHDGNTYVFNYVKGNKMVILSSTDKKALADFIKE